MNIILTEKVNNLGKLGDTVNVKDGYARNFLLPQGKAIRATKENLEIFSKEKSKRESENQSNKNDAEKLSESIKNLSIIILRPASETGQLYGSVSTRDISNEVLKKGFTITHKQVILQKTVRIRIAKN
jgi:large subunit ribosomal protein L9